MNFSFLFSFIAGRFFLVPPFLLYLNMLRLLSILGLYIQPIWSNNKLLPKAQWFGLEMSNKFNDYCYRLRIVYKPEIWNKYLKEKARYDSRSHLYFYTDNLLILDKSL